MRIFYGAQRPQAIGYSLALLDHHLAKAADLHLSEIGRQGGHIAVVLLEHQLILPHGVNGAK